MRNSFGLGDVVTYGKSNTEWTITEETSPAEYTLKSEKGSTKRNVSWDKLTLVRDAAPTLTDAQIEELDETYAEHGMPAAQDRKAEMLTENDEFMLSIDGDGTEPNGSGLLARWELELLYSENVNSDRPVALNIDGEITWHKTFGAAADTYVFANREKPVTLATIDAPGRKRVTRGTAR